MTRWSRLHAKSLLVLSLVLLPASRLAAQGSAGTGGHVEPRFIVDMPTAGLLAKETYAVDALFYGDGGLLVGFSAGILGRLAVGLSYGGSGIIGGGEPVMNPAPGFYVKVRVIDEAVVFPAIALGFDSQGYDGYIKESNRYVVKSPGFYGAISKNYDMLGYLSIHGGINYSLERADGDRDVNFYVGADKSLGPFASIVGEYNLGMNDSDHGASGKGRGYLNFALNVSPGSGLTIGICFKDILQNGREGAHTTRTVKIEFVNTY